MKKTLVNIALMAVVGFSGSAIAAANFVNGTAVTPDDCPLLAENVTINLSNNVKGAYSCNVASGTIKAATCSEGGSRKATTAPCVFDEATDTWNNAACNESTPNFTTSELGKAFYGSSKGGQIATMDLTAACSDASVAAVDKLD